MEKPKTRSSRAKAKSSEGPHCVVTMPEGDVSMQRNAQPVGLSTKVAAVLQDLVLKLLQHLVQQYLTPENVVWASLRLYNCFRAPLDAGFNKVFNLF